MENSIGVKFKLYALTISTWSMKYLLSRFRQYEKPLNILFCTVDHYEPGTGGVNEYIEKQRVDELIEKYPKFADKHRDSGNNILKRTWFFPPHYHRNRSIRKLVSICKQGYGEIELHLHHGKVKPDTQENLEMTIQQTIEEYGLFGIFGSEKNRRRYGFIHGDWALNNSRNGKYCGVDNEIEILKRTGCYADFTFPSMNEANPRMINSIYYAKDDDARPKPYTRGRPVRKGDKLDQFMIIQGPLHPYFKNDKLYNLRILNDSIDQSNPNTRKRADWWIRTSIHVKGKPEWIIIKTHTHGAIDQNVVLGNPFGDLISYLESKYNDGEAFRIHYVTARELYNIIKAAEAGEEGGDPGAYRDYVISPPAYDDSVECHEASDKLKGLLARTYR